MHALRTLFTLTVVVALPASAAATGLSKPVLVGPKAIGMGGAFVSIADDPTAIFHNAAGLTRVKGHRAQIGFDALLTNLDYTPTGAATETAKGELLPVPALALTTDIAAPFTFGLGVFIPHGSGATFESNSAIVTNPNEGRIFSLEITPAMAVELAPDLSVGVTFRIVRISSEIKQQQVVIGPFVDNLEEFNLSGWGFGASVGVLYEPMERLSVGANYRPRLRTTLDGDALFTGFGPFDAKLFQTLPSLLTAGASYEAIDGLTIALGYGFERNSEVKSLFGLLNDFFPVSLPQNWEDSHTIHIGVDYAVSKALSLRAGYAKDLNESIPDTAVTRIIGDVAAHELSAGGAYTFGHYTLSVAWNGRFGPRSIPANETNPGPGEYSAFLNSFSAAVAAAY